VIQRTVVGGEGACGAAAESVEEYADGECEDALRDAHTESCGGLREVL